MAARIRQFNADIKAFAKVLDIGLGLATQKITLDIHKGLVEKTPVDTGRARAAWDTTIGAPSEYEGPPKTDAPGESNGGSATYPAPEAPPVEDIDGTAVVYIMNNVVYIEPLENGHSAQAPNGMIALTVAEAQAEITTILQGLQEEAESNF